MSRVCALPGAQRSNERVDSCVCKLLDKNCCPTGLQIRRNAQGESPKKKAMKLRFSTILSIYTKLDLHHLTQLASSAQFEMDLRLEQSNLFFCVIALPS